MCRFIIVVCFLFAYISPSLSATWTNGTQEVKHIMWRPNIKGFYVVPGTFDDPECNTTSNLYVIDTTLDQNSLNQLYSMLLTAFATGNKLHVWVDGCDSGTPKFTGLQLNK